jgi:hypothetical protein
MGVSGQFHAATILTLRKETPVLTGRELHQSQIYSRYGVEEKNLCPFLQSNHDFSVSSHSLF